MEAVKGSETIWDITTFVKPRPRPIMRCRQMGGGIEKNEKRLRARLAEREISSAGL